MRALYFEFYQETNSFCPLHSDLKNFQNYKLCRGADVLKVEPGVRYETSGFLKAAEEYAVELIPSIGMFSQSSGPVDGALVDMLMKEVRKTYEEAGAVDMVWMLLHGSTQDTRPMPYDDTCGSIAEEVRAMVGPDVVIAASFDLHANITPRLLSNVNVCCGYQTYPHEDAYETAYRAGTLAVKKCRDADAFVTAAVRIPMILPASGYTSREGIFHDIMQQGFRFVEEGMLLDFSVFQMQPWLDAETPGSTVLAIGRDAKTAGDCAALLAQRLFDSREQCWPEMYSMDEVIDLALANEKEGPVILCNSGDSPGAGAIGDSVAVLHRLLERKVDMSYATLVLDADAVQKAFEVGVGNSARFTFGACLSGMGQTPVVEDATVRSLHDGCFLQEGPISRGLQQCAGRVAVISIGSYDVLLCEYPANTGDPQMFRHFGIEPTLYDMVEVKANTSFRLPYSKFAADIFVTDVPGCLGTSKLLSLPFKNIGKGFYPFDKLEDYRLEAPVFYR